MHLDPVRLLVLRAVRRAGGVLPAARLLQVTPSGISQHLRRLEMETGLVLVDRSHRGGGRSLQLTADGLRLADQADRVADVLADAERAVEVLRGRQAGPVVIGGFASSLAALVAPAVAALAVAHPAIDPRVVEADSTTGIRDLLAGHLDLLICDRTNQTPARTNAQIHEEELVQDPFRIVVPSTWDPAISVADLLAGPWVTTPTEFTTDRVLADLAAEYDATPKRLHVCTESTSVLSLVAAGLGAAIVPALTVAHLGQIPVRVLETAPNPGVRLITVCHRQGDCRAWDQHPIRAGPAAGDRSSALKLINGRRLPLIELACRMCPVDGRPVRSVCGLRSRWVSRS